jgi:hypothetical protein
MAATIDHLAAGRRVAVIQAFIDADGRRVEEGAIGTIRAIEIDLPRMRVTVRWRRETGEETLAFSLLARDGPGNGRMRAYFSTDADEEAADGEDVVFAPIEPPPQASRPQPKPKPGLASPPKPLAPSAETSLEERTVACGCDPVFHRPLVPAGTLGVHACLCCGTVTVTRTVGDDGRYTGEAWTAYIRVPTPAPVLAWLGRFPRARIDYAGARSRWPMAASLMRYPMMLYPANLRVADEAELSAVEARLAPEQAGICTARRLSLALGSLPLPPPDLPDPLAGFAMIERAIRTPPEDLATLRWLAQLLSPAKELAAEKLLARSDARAQLLAWLGSPDELDFEAGIAMLRDARAILSGPEDQLFASLREILAALPMAPSPEAPSRVESWFRLEALLVAIADLGLPNQALIADLKSLARRLAGKDVIAPSAISIVVKELQSRNAPA